DFLETILQQLLGNGRRTFALVGKLGERRARNITRVKLSVNIIRVKYPCLVSILPVGLSPPVGRRRSISRPSKPLSSVGRSAQTAPVATNSLKRMFPEEVVIAFFGLGEVRRLAAWLLDGGRGARFCAKRFDEFLQTSYIPTGLYVKKKRDHRMAGNQAEIGGRRDSLNACSRF